MSKILLSSLTIAFVLTFFLSFFFFQWMLDFNLLLDLIYWAIVLLYAGLMRKKQHFFSFPSSRLCVVLVVPLPPFIGKRGADCGSNVWAVLAGQWGVSWAAVPSGCGTGWQPGRKALLKIRRWESDWASDRLKYIHINARYGRHC